MSHSPAYSKVSHSAAFCYVRSVRKQGGEHKSQSARAVMTASPVPSRQQLRGKAFFAKWPSVGWSKQDVESAAETGLSRERIRQIRNWLALQSPRTKARCANPQKHC